MDRVAHWNHVYETKPPDTVSWFQRSPDRSLEYIRKLTGRAARIIDIGGGASGLVDSLLNAGYERPLVLDVSAAALAHTQQRLGSRVDLVEWIVSDVIGVAELPPVDLWHDRAVLHFLADPVDQAAYADLARRTVRSGGHLVIATFALDGPEKCSGLPVQRHDGASLSQLLGGGFELVEESREVHVTPGGSEQRFQWGVFQRR